MIVETKIECKRHCEISIAYLVKDQEPICAEIQKEQDQKKEDLPADKNREDERGKPNAESADEIRRQIMMNLKGSGE
jgi:hypothetical protein